MVAFIEGFHCISKMNIPRRVYQGRERISMQQQEEGSNNCGLFSIAATYHAAKRDNIAAITFNENRMRSHLVHCFEHQVQENR